MHFRSGVEPEAAEEIEPLTDLAPLTHKSLFPERLNRPWQRTKEQKMKKWISAAAVTAFAFTAIAMVLAAGASAGNGTGITATPAGTKTFNTDFSAQFVRSASGIINETNRVNTKGDHQNPWTSADVWLQFRPQTGPDGTGSPKADPTCDSQGLVVAPFTFVNTNGGDPNIGGTPTNGYFIGRNPYNVCVYLVNPVVASGTIDSSASDGATADLAGLTGQFRINVSGTYTNGGNNVADAEYTSTDNWTTSMQGYDINPYFLGEGFGDVQVNGGFVNWGAYDGTGHAYSLTGAQSGSVNLAVFDGDSNTNTKTPGWYGDNTGSLSYTITYLGL
jgi:hypothetical protein